jgi:hypothetical protein
MFYLDNIKNIINTETLIKEEGYTTDEFSLLDKAIDSRAKILLTKS